MKNIIRLVAHPAKYDLYVDADDIDRGIMTFIPFEHMLIKNVTPQGDIFAKYIFNTDIQVGTKIKYTISNMNVFQQNNCQLPVFNNTIKEVTPDILYFENGEKIYIKDFIRTAYDIEIIE